MSEHNDWEIFFDRHAPYYMQNVFTQNTAKEVEFLIRELNLPAGSRIIDIGCGTGRHSIGLAKRGYEMTGVDLSSGMLTEAKKAADEAGVVVEWINADAAVFITEETFDAAICLCEGAFGLLGKDQDGADQALKILKNIHEILKPDARLILNALNGLRMIRLYSAEDITAGKFNPVQLVEYGELQPAPDGPEIKTREKGFVPSELKLVLQMAGFSVLAIWGGTAGNWGHRPIDPDEMEIMALAVRSK